jgi:hypothetical protein
LLVPAYVIVCGVLSQGRLQWWSDAPWLGIALICAVTLITAAILVERRRAHPLLQVERIVKNRRVHGF